MTKETDKETLFTIEGKMNGVVCDEGIVYKSKGRYYLHWIGLGKTKQISKKAVIEYERELKNDERRVY